jgi:hypothetical protein
MGLLAPMESAAGDRGPHLDREGLMPRTTDDAAHEPVVIGPGVVALSENRSAIFLDQFSRRSRLRIAVSVYAQRAQRVPARALTVTATVTKFV